MQTLVLGVLAGAFIAFGGMSYTVVVTGSELGFGPTRLLGGIAFSLGLILVVIGGAELFTGNNLIAMAWAERRVTTRRLLRNWLLVYVGNAVGAVAVLLSGIPMRPASESATRGSVIKSAEPVSRKRPGRGSTSTVALIARIKSGAR